MTKTDNIINTDPVYSSYESKDTGVVIPRGTVRIGVGAFKGNKCIEKVTIPEGVRCLDAEAFMGCTSLRSVSFPESLGEIPPRAFMGCTSLETVLIPGVESIGEEAFRGCTSLTYVKVFNGCEKVGIDAFNGCTSLETVDLPDSVKLIGSRAFNGCTSLRELTPARNIEALFDECFSGCELLKESLAKKARLYEMLHKGGVCAVISNNRLECFDDTVTTDFVIPDGVETIAADAFKGCSKLEELTIPESVCDIELGAFDDCTNLSVINVPDNFTLLEASDLYQTKWYRDRRDGFVILGTVLLEYNGRDKEIAVPDGITAIVDKALVNAEPDRILCYPQNAKSVFPGAVSDIGEPMIAIYYN
ncbi:MAG: leucine-rich repeat domain-containing protein [Ruminococcus sp.]|nr:leucine-rich repeat domain-containing protein [Ruminococcus sp.]